MALRARGFLRRLGGVRLCSTDSSAITRKNFPAALKQLRSHLRQSEFVAIDLEMSGMHSSPWRRSMELDTIETRYHNIRDSAEKFSVFQCGICLFRYDSPHNKFIAYPYNFYLFPRNELSLERDFLCQTSSLEFLAKHKFDFNACIYNGISYLSRTEEKKARELIDKRSEEDKDVPDVAMRRTSDVIFSEKVRLQVGLWRSSKIMAKHKKQEAGTPASDEFPSLVINITDKRQCKLVVQAVSRNFDDLIPIVDESGDEITQVKVIYTGSAERKVVLQADLEKEKEEIIMSDLTEAVGFRHVIDAIAFSKKPVIGHNCILDLAHIHSKFIGPLPEDFSSFCSTIHKLFPVIVDTKYILKSQTAIRDIGISVSSLYPVYSYFFGSGPRKAGKSETFSRVNIEIAEDFMKYSDTESRHEAGFDAYMTGAIFVQLWRLISPSQSQMEFRALAENIYRNMRGISNLLYLGWAGHYVLDLTTGQEAQGAKALPERSSYSSFRPASDASVIVWTESLFSSSKQVHKLVKSCFIGTHFSSESETIPIDDNSAFVIFKSMRSKQEFIQAYESISGGLELNPIATKLTKYGLKVSSFEMFEKLCKSGISTRRLADAIQMLKDSEDDDFIDEHEEITLQA